MSQPTAPQTTLAPDTLPELLAPTRPGTSRPLLPPPLEARPHAPGWGRAWRSCWPLAVSAAMISGGMISLLADFQQPRSYDSAVTLQLLDPGDDPGLTPAGQMTLLRTLAEQPQRWLDGGTPPFVPGLMLADPGAEAIEIRLRGRDPTTLERQVRTVVALHRQELRSHHDEWKTNRERTRVHREAELARIEAKLKAMPVAPVVQDNQGAIQAAELSLERASGQRKALEAELTDLRRPRDPEIPPIAPSVADGLLRRDVRGVRLMEDRAGVVAGIEKIRRIATPTAAADLLPPEQKKLSIIDLQLDELTYRLTQPLRDQARIRWETNRQERIERLTEQVTTARTIEQAASKHLDRVRATPEGVDPRVASERDRLDEDRRQLAEEVLALSKNHADSTGCVVLNEATGETRASNRHLGTLVAGLVGGLGFGGLVVARQRAFGKVRSVRELADTTGLPVLGRLPMVGNAVPIPGVKPGGAAGQEIQRLEAAVDLVRGPVLSQMNPGPVRLLITSPGSGDGRTTLATQLACSLARAGKRVLLVDGTSGRPDLAWLFQLNPEPGLAEVLRGEQDLGDVLQATSFSRLWLLPAGHADSQSRAALARDWSSSLFEPVLGQLDFVVIDGPALDAGPEASAWASRCQGVILAARADHTPLPASHAACRRLHLLQVPVLGLVLLERGTLDPTEE